MHKIIEIDFSQFPFWARVKLCWRILRNQTACHLAVESLPEMLPEKVWQYWTGKEWVNYVWRN